MELALITVKQVVVLFILIFAGFVCVKTKAVKMEGKKAFSDLLLYLIVPAMVINSYMMEFNIDILHNLLKAFELSILLLLIGLFITLALTAKHKSPDLPIMRFACIFSNAAYMGFPLIQALFGSEGLLYASAFVTVYNILLWTAGYGIVSSCKRGFAYNLYQSGADFSCGRTAYLSVSDSCAGHYKTAGQSGWQYEYTAVDVYYRHDYCGK